MSISTFLLEAATAAAFFALGWFTCSRRTIRALKGATKGLKASADALQDAVDKNKPTEGGQNGKSSNSRPDG